VLSTHSSSKILSKTDHLPQFHEAVKLHAQKAFAAPFYSSYPNLHNFILRDDCVISRIVKLFEDPLLGHDCAYWLYYALHYSSFDVSFEEKIPGEPYASVGLFAIPYPALFIDAIEDLIGDPLAQAHTFRVLCKLGYKPRPCPAPPKSWPTSEEWLRLVELLRYPDDALFKYDMCSVIDTDTAIITSWLLLQIFK